MFVEGKQGYLGGPETISGNRACEGKFLNLLALFTFFSSLAHTKLFGKKKNGRELIYFNKLKQTERGFEN